ncbi:Hypothetical predicted protein [Olea europaea subsp. europaea]|uniref:DUF1985 domain-containing protein n=1 Tax=Olea europaea subsp. europaea TaxID=158383 RepID=A0A8S0QVF2_OLEEU|nr:Hypothetical predicted protein [Olea europaea subsp. europaea]
MEKIPSRLKNLYFPTLKNVTHEDINDAFLRATDILDENVFMLDALYFITFYLHPKGYKKALDHFLFVLVEDFNVMNVFPWGKSMFDMQVADDHPSATKLEGPECFSNPDLEICALDPPLAEMAMTYVTEVWYKKHVPPDRSRGEKRNGGSIDRSVYRAGASTNPSDMGMNQSTPMLLITGERLGHSDVHIDDDDFVDPSPNWKGTSIQEDSLSEERKSDDTIDLEDLPSKDSQVSSLKSDQQKKLKLLVRMKKFNDKDDAIRPLFPLFSTG